MKNCFWPYTQIHGGNRGSLLQWNINFIDKRHKLGKVGVKVYTIMSTTRIPATLFLLIKLVLNLDYNYLWKREKNILKRQTESKVSITFHMWFTHISSPILFYGSMSVHQTASLSMVYEYQTQYFSLSCKQSIPNLLFHYYFRLKRQRKWTQQTQKHQKLLNKNMC